jgi:nicotinate-nucleotide adenylyltransferase
MRIGIFGGSFDPIHNEHIALARQAVVDLSLDRLFVMPAANPPHKPWRVLTSDVDRLKTCELAFAGDEKISVSDYELKKGGASYTYLTVRYFRQLYPDAEIFFLMGTDMLRNFPLWKEPTDILQNATLAVCARAEEQGWAQEEQSLFYEKFGVKFAVLSYEGKDVSSTKIRVLAGAGLDLTPFTDEKVAKYIQEKGLYAIEGAAASLALQKPSRAAHSVRVAMLAAKRAGELHLSEKKALQACLLHDCAKNLAFDNPLLQGFTPPKDCPSSVLHQYAGEYVARTYLGVTDEEVLSAIACHTSGKENMSTLDKLVFLADLVEEERSYPGVERLRRLFWEDLDACLLAALEDTVEYLTRSGMPIDGRTLAAREYYQKEKNYGRNVE